MYHRQLGPSGIEVSALGLGCWAIGGPFDFFDGTPAGWGTIDDAESIRAIHRALDLGVTLFDTADVYGAGHSEEVLGKALAGRRDQVVIATKFGNTFDPATRRMISQNADPAYIRSALEASLRRLGTDYIDLYQFHVGEYPADQAAPVRETLEALVAEGKIRGYGWSTDTLESVQVFAEGPHCIAAQLNFNIFEGNDELLAFCETRGLAVLNRGPLAMGLLTGKFRKDSTFADDDVRKHAAWFAGSRDGRPNPEWLDRLDAIREILTSGGRTLAQGALAWLWARSDMMLPIPGFKTLAQVEENAGALRFGPLTAEQMAEIEQLLGRQQPA